MPKFVVTATRTERITFEIHAVDREDATARYLTDGDEIASETVSLTVEDEDVTEAQYASWSTVPAESVARVIRDHMTPR